MAINQAREDGTEINPFVAEAATVWVRSRLSASSIIKREPKEQCMHISCCLGIQIYLTTVIDRFMELGFDQLDLVSRLKSSLSGIDIKTTQSHFVLWTIFFGGLAATNMRDRCWFVSQLRDITRDLNIRDWDSLESTLKRLSWVETRHGSLGRLLWHITIMNDPSAY
jgi:hypothetical protein